MSALWEFDQVAIESNDYLIGIDEAGRGPFAGSVVASAVCVDKSFFKELAYIKRTSEINDSKQLTSKKRESFFKEIISIAGDGALTYGIAEATVAEIEEFNILGATIKAMLRAFENLVEKHDALNMPTLENNLPLFQNEKDPLLKIMIDGKPIKKFPFSHEGVVKGDGKSLVIAMASILAKETRDKALMELDKKYPAYEFSRHKGYGTKIHREKILEHGPCPEHRLSFLRNLLVNKP